MLKELWILTRDGLPLVCFTEEGADSENLVCGFISALQSFCNELTSDDLRIIQLQDEKITMSTCLDETALIVCKTTGKIKEKKIQKMTNMIKNMFEKMYKAEDLKDWNGDLSLFDNFRNRISLYFKLVDL